MGDYVVDPYPLAKFHEDTITPFRPPPNTRKFVSSNSATFFWFLLQPTAKTPAPIFTINTSNDVVSRKDVPFGGPENFDPIFPPKRKFLANFRRDLETQIWGHRRPTIYRFRDPAKFWTKDRLEGLNNWDARE